jgi:hypothetical protein
LRCHSITDAGQRSQHAASSFEGEGVDGGVADVIQEIEGLEVDVHLMALADREDSGEPRIRASHRLQIQTAPGVERHARGSTESIQRGVEGGARKRNPGDQHFSRNRLRRSERGNLRDALVEQHFRQAAASSAQCKLAGGADHQAMPLIELGRSFVQPVVAVEKRPWTVAEERCFRGRRPG